MIDLEAKAYTIFHYGFPPIVLFGQDKLHEYLDSIHTTIGIERIVSSTGEVLHLKGVNEGDPWQMVPFPGTI